MTMKPKEEFYENTSPNKWWEGIPLLRKWFLDKRFTSKDK